MKTAHGFEREGVMYVNIIHLRCHSRKKIENHCPDASYNSIFRILHNHICCLKPRVPLPTCADTFNKPHLLGEKEGCALKSVASVPQRTGKAEPGLAWAGPAKTSREAELGPVDHVDSVCQGPASQPQGHKQARTH